MFPHSTLMALTDGLLSAALLITSIVIAGSLLRKQKALPPGPKGWPLIGNVLDIPEKQPWLKYAEWSREFDSPVIHVKALGTSIVVANDLQSAKEILEEKGANFAGRPRMANLNEAAGFDWSFGFMPDMVRWKICRREFESRFRQISVKNYWPQQHAMAVGLLDRLLETPDDFVNHLRVMTYSFILDITYGIQVKKEDDEFIEYAEVAQASVERALEKNIVDIIPWIQRVPRFFDWLPGMGWRKEADVWKVQASRAQDAPFEFVQKQALRGVAKPCFATDLMDNFEPDHPNALWRDIILKGTTGSAYSAGTHTTVVVLSALILALVLHPEVQTRAQTELGRVVGHHRLPELTDQDELPYITAIVKEILRWTVITPFAIPHTNADDDVYNGYFIPKGSVVMANTWAILRDPVAFPEPDEFKPERWLTEDGKLDNKAPDLDAAFGYGRRICPGRFLVMDAMWLSAASVLSIFEIKPKANKSPPSGQFEFGFIIRPSPFECDIKPRSSSAIQLVRDAQMHM